eukprot:gnl/MRDRNA2_/MRDRNA2_86642_c0_seq1.p3 gnl/MRDRNA2_/MRDRNA2_86642_c0~~gnl/MRDRNA2_/MRDRNA2_86642_c0_seq1.p3  ORF type:complete len:108 (-),score=4.20 gnl/MRDRNA2_/MRDRNA2_86642_c0_seq1:1075-1398(-)
MKNRKRLDNQTLNNTRHAKQKPGSEQPLRDTKGSLYETEQHTTLKNDKENCVLSPRPNKTKHRTSSRHANKTQPTTGPDSKCRSLNAEHRSTNNRTKQPQKHATSER